jgi:hypothetical protein
MLNGIKKIFFKFNLQLEVLKEIKLKILPILKEHKKA